MKIVLPNNHEIELASLRQAVCKGKREGWASGKDPVRFDNGDEGYELMVGENIRYRDSYFGLEGFMGGERMDFISDDVHFTNKPLWGMNYSDVFRLPKGFPLEEANPFKKEVMRFLKDCLLQVPEDFPFRGSIDQVKRKVMGRELTYINTPLALKVHHATAYVGGDLIFREFQGFESILMETDKPGEKNEFIFNLVYHGRLLVPESWIRE